MQVIGAAFFEQAAEEEVPAEPGEGEPIQFFEEDGVENAVLQVAFVEDGKRAAVKLSVADEGELAGDCVPFFVADGDAWLSGVEGLQAGDEVGDPDRRTAPCAPCGRSCSSNPAR